MVHLDLPWTPARLEQRVGRIARAGSPHAVIEVRIMGAPASARALLRVEHRLRQKARAAMQGFGIALAGASAGAQSGEPATARPSPREALRTRLDRWAGAVAGAGNEAMCLIAAVSSRGPRARGILALVRTDGIPHLVWLPARGSPTARPTRIVRLLDLVEGCAPLPVDHRAAPAALHRIAAWQRSERARAALGGDAEPSAAPALRGTVALALLRRTTAAVQLAPWHRRAELRPLVGLVAQLVRRPLPHGAELELRELVAAPDADEEWLRLVAARVAALIATQTPRAPRGTAGDEVLAVLISAPLHPV